MFQAFMGTSSRKSENPGLMVMCSKKPEPAAWSIIGTMYSVHFLHYKDMEDYIIRRGLTRWTDEHDRESGLCLSGISNRCRIF